MEVVYKTARFYPDGCDRFIDIEDGDVDLSLVDRHFFATPSFGSFDHIRFAQVLEIFFSSRILDHRSFGHLGMKGPLHAFRIALEPPLLYLHCFLKKHGFKIETIPVPEEGLKRFLSEFKITDREKEIIELLIEGLSNKEISKKLFISIKTVKNHVTNIYTKTSVNNRVQLSNLIRNL